MNIYSRFYFIIILVVYFTFFSFLSLIYIIHFYRHSLWCECLLHKIFVYGKKKKKEILTVENTLHYCQFLQTNTHIHFKKRTCIHTYIHTFIQTHIHSDRKIIVTGKIYYARDDYV